MRCRSRRRTGRGRRSGGCRRRRPAAGRRRRGRCRSGPSAWSRGPMTRSRRSFSVILIFLSMPSSSTISSTASRRRVLPTMSRGLMVAISARACCGGQELLGPAGEKLQQQPVQPVDGLGSGAAELVAAVDEHAHHDQVVDRPAPAPGSGCAARPRRPSARRPGRSCGRCRWRTPAPAPTASRGTSSTVSPSCDQPVRDVLADAVAALHRPHPVSELPPSRQHLRVAGLVGAEPAHRQHVARARRRPRSWPNACAGPSR